MTRLTRRAALGGSAAMLLSSPARAEEELRGVQVDYAWDGRSTGHPELAWSGRAYVPPSSAAGPRPLVVFLHGLNRALIRYRWMGGGEEGDLRRLTERLVTRKAIAPAVIAAPSSVVASQVSRGASWRRFDLDHFLDLTLRALAPHVRIDERAIVVAGHSGAGCSMSGGIATAAAGQRKLLGLLSIDTCMAVALADRLARAPRETHVVVAYQTLGWGDRPFRDFERAFRRVVEAHPPAEGVLRELDHQKPERAYHDATVALTFERWLPRLLPPERDTPKEPPTKGSQ